MHLIRKSMKDFVKNLPAQRFVRVHKSFVVQVEKIAQLGPNYVVIEGQEIPLTTSARGELMAYLGIG